MMKTQNQLSPILLISCLLLVWVCADPPSSELMDKAKKCAEEMQGMYDQLCTAAKGDGAKVVDIKKKCIQYPDKLAAQKVSSEHTFAAASQSQSINPSLVLFPS